MGPADGQQELSLFQLIPVLCEGPAIFVEVSVSVAILHSPSPPSQVIHSSPVPSCIPPPANMVLPAARFFLADLISWLEVYSENFQ